MSSPKIQIRCPNCHRDGHARPELINRKVSCKHCSHVFRAVPVDDDGAAISPPPASPEPVAAPVAAEPASADKMARESSRRRVEALEQEVRQLRVDLAARDAEYAKAARDREELVSLRAQIAHAIDDARRAEEHRSSLEAEHAGREQSLVKEVSDLREKLDRAEPSAEDVARDRARDEEIRTLRGDLERARREAAEAEAARGAERDAAIREALAQLDHASAEARAAEARAAAGEAARVEADGRHVEEVQDLRTERDAARDELAEARRALDELRAESKQPEAEGQHAEAIQGLVSERDAARDELAEARRALDELRAARDELAESRRALDELRADRERADAEGARSLEEARAQLDRARSELAAAEAARAGAEGLAGERDALRARLDEADRLAAEARAATESLRRETGRAEEAEARREALAREAEATLRDRDEARAQVDRLREERDALRARLDEADRPSDAPGTVMELPLSGTGTAGDAPTVFDGLDALPFELERARAEAEALRAELAEATARLGRKDAELADLARHRAAAGDGGAALAEGDRAELDALRLERDRAIAAGEQDRVALDALRFELDQAREAADQGRAELEALRLRSAPALEAESPDRAELDALRAELDQARASDERGRVALDALRFELDQAREAADQGRAELEALRAGTAPALAAEQPDRAELESLRFELDQARASVEQDRVAFKTLRAERDAARAAAGHDRAELEALRRRPIPARSAEQADLDDLDDLRAELDQARASDERGRVALDALRFELDQAREAADQGRAELEALRAQLESLRLQSAQALAADDPNRAELDAVRAELAEVRAADERGRVALDALRFERDEARTEAEAATRSIEELTGRIRSIEASRDPVAGDPAASRLAVEEAAKGAWSDFERRLAETQAKLKAANARAEMLENQSREGHTPGSGSRRAREKADASSPGDAAPTAGNRTAPDRGAARLTQEEAKARLGLARLLAVERKDKSLIDRIAKMVDKVHADLDARNDALAEALVRGAEIEVGLDPGGWSLRGLKVFRPGPSIVDGLAALAPGFDWAMRSADPDAIRSTIGEMRRILGDQAGLPEVRRPGLSPPVKRPIAEADAVRLFLGALEAENWLTRPVAAGRPLPETSLPTFAALIEACHDARGAVQRHAPDRLELIDGVIRASSVMLARRQQADGHFSFLDPRGRASELASTVEEMAAERPEAVKDGWVLAIDPSGVAQFETGLCGVALAKAAASVGRPEWAQAARRAADWAMAQPCLTRFPVNASSASLLARAYLAAPDAPLLDGLIARLTLGLLPGQVDNGRWIDPASARTPDHLVILRALHDAWEALPADRHQLRSELKSSIDRALAALLDEVAVLGVPARGGALRDLIRHRDLFRPELDPRLEPAILDAATVVQELCHDATKTRLGVAPDQLAALTLI